MNTASVRLISALSLLALLTIAQNIPAGIGEGWLPEFDHASRQLVALAEATPAEKFTWRPAPGIRAVSEVYMHVAAGNYGLLNYAGLTVPDTVMAQLKSNIEKTVTKKADVLKWLKDSQTLVRESYPKADRQKKLKFLGHDTNVDGVLLRILVHSHEHMGQSIAYARMIGVVPPWSQ